jgi:CelD/BcsL family acetyltransferase involved in cellulose biosynthesis
MAVTVSVVTSDRGLDRLEPEWSDLADAADSTIFQTFEWVRAWWGFFGADRELRCLAFRDGDRLVGIAPLVKEPVRVGGVRVATRLRFLGHPQTLYHDLLVRRGHEGAVMDRFAAHLRADVDDWDVLDVDSALGESSTVSRAPRVLGRHGVRVCGHQTDVSPMVPLPPSWDLFLQGLGKNRRSKFNRLLRQLTTHHQVDVETFRHEGDDLPAAVEDLARMHEARWQSLGYPGVVRDRPFYVDVATRFARRGWLRLSFLAVDTRRVAASLDFHYRNRIYAFLGNVAAPAPLLRYSPGFLLMCLTIRTGIAEGIGVYDLLCGAHPYKYEQFKAVDRPVYRMRAVSPRGRARATALAALELGTKACGRVRREYYDLQRLRRTAPTPAALGRALVTRGATLGALAARYVDRHFARLSSDVRGLPAVR